LEKSPEFGKVNGKDNLTRFRVGKMLPNQEVHERWARLEGMKSNGSRSTGG
jgi:hypothetical protein